jgi:hypothetical protein
LIPFFEEILPSDLNLSEGLVLASEGFIPTSEGYIPTSPVILELSDSTEYCQCEYCVGYEDEEMLEEIEIVGGYLYDPIVPRIPMKFLSQEEKNIRLREFECKWITIL